MLEKKLKKLASRLSKILYFKKLSASICDKGYPAIFIYPATTIPRTALEEIANAFTSEGLVPIFEEVKGSLLIKWVPIVSVKKCEPVETKTTNLPEELLKEDNPQCVKFYLDIFNKDKGSVLLFLLPECEHCIKLQKFIWEDQLGIESEIEASLLQEGLNNLYEIQPAECPSYPKVFQLSKYPTGLLVIRGKVIDRCEGYEECKKKIKKWLLEIDKYVTLRLGEAYKKKNS